MNRLFALGVALLLTACGKTVAVPPQTPASQAAATVAPAAVRVDADPALWVVKDADTTIYLFGTVHVLKPGLGWFDEAVKDAFDKSDSLVLELVMPAPEIAQATALKAGTAAAGTPPLSQRLAPRTRTKYLAQVASFGIPATTFDRFTPWFAANNLSILPLLKMGYALDSGAEQILTRAAKDAGKPIGGLETLDEQLGFFAGLSQRAQLGYLTNVVDELPGMGKTIDAMVVDWSRGDPAALAKLLNEGLTETPELSKILLSDRNARWAGWIAKRLETPGTVFVAVGAGHLAGKQGVQAKLAARGIAATRIAY